MTVVDASAVLEVLLQTRAANSISRRLLSAREILCAPHLLDVEVAQVLRRYSAIGELTAERGFEAFEDLADFPLTRYPHQPFLKRIWELRNNVTAYDAAYLALAEALAAPLITCDRRLAASPGHTVRVELLASS